MEIAGGAAGCAPDVEHLNAAHDELELAGRVTSPEHPADQVPQSRPEPRPETTSTSPFCMLAVPPGQLQSTKLQHECMTSDLSFREVPLEVSAPVEE